MSIILYFRRDALWIVRAEFSFLFYYADDSELMDVDDRGDEDKGSASVVQEIFAIETETNRGERDGDGEQETEDEDTTAGGGIRSNDSLLLLPAVSLDSDSDSERDSDESRISPRPNDDAREMPSSGAVSNSNVPDAKAKTARPGEGYAVYSADDVLGRLPEAYAAVLGRAAGWCGVSGDELGGVVERFERRLGRLFARQRRRERERERKKERE